MFDVLDDIIHLVMPKKSDLGGIMGIPFFLKSWRRVIVNTGTFLSRLVLGKRTHRS